MNLPKLTDLLPDLSHPPVRDLAWTLLSPPLLSDPAAPQRHPLAASRWAEQPDELIDWLGLLDARPAVLDAWLAQRSIRRLGLYYERLWQFALYQAPDVDLLVANLPVRQGRHTLGELDLLTRDSEGVHHIELAVKFYLGLGGDCRSHEYWLGPGSHDRLDLKLRRLIQHQLQLCATPAAKALLRELTCCEINSALWLGGYLFTPKGQDCTPPSGAHPEHHRGRWMRHCDWHSFAAYGLDTYWQPLPRHAWLAPVQLNGESVWARSDFDKWLIDVKGQHQAKLLVRLEPSGHGKWIEQERMFLVPDNWPSL